MSFFNKPPRYRTFLLTLWEERNEAPNLPTVWRFRLEDPRTDQQQGFTSLEALVAALKQEMGAPRPQEPGDTTKEGNQDVSQS
jgi:hypothetical protein